jgi:hypothetical protein
LNQKKSRQSCSILSTIFGNINQNAIVNEASSFILKNKKSHQTKFDGFFCIGSMPEALKGGEMPIALEADRCLRLSKAEKCLLLSGVSMPEAFEGGEMPMALEADRCLRLSKAEKCLRLSKTESSPLLMHTSFHILRINFLYIFHIL